jgi:hypothetical protein
MEDLKTKSFTSESELVEWTNNNEVKVEGITYVFTYVLFYREILK